MSARIVGVTTLLIDVLNGANTLQKCSPSETALVDLLGPEMDELLRIRQLALAEMQALAPAVLQADAEAGRMQ